MLGLIDPPSPFAPTKEWQEFLQGLRNLPPKDRQHPHIKQAIKDAVVGLAKSRRQSFAKTVTA